MALLPVKKLMRVLIVFIVQVRYEVMAFPTIFWLRNIGGRENGSKYVRAENRAIIRLSTRDLTNPLEKKWNTNSSLIHLSFLTTQRKVATGQLLGRATVVTKKENKVSFSKPLSLILFMISPTLSSKFASIAAKILRWMSLMCLNLFMYLSLA